MGKKGQRNKKYTLQEAHQIVNSAGFTPLFTEYINARTPFLVRYLNNHEYKVQLGHLKKGAKCKQCYHDSMRTSEETLHLKYKEVGLDIISFPNGYKNANSLVEFKCPKGHITITQVRLFKEGKRCADMKCINDRRKQTNEESGAWVLDKDRSAFNVYENEVNRLTNKSFKEHEDIINPKNLKREIGFYHLDHKFSKIAGFQLDIPPLIISYPSNLQMLTESENCSKGSECSITYEQLMKFK